MFLWFSGSVNWNVQWLFSIYCINLLIHNPSTHSFICPSLLFFALHFTYFSYFCNEFKCPVSTVCLCWSVSCIKQGVFRAFWHMWNKKKMVLHARSLMKRCILKLAEILSKSVFHINNTLQLSERIPARAKYLSCFIFHHERE